MNSSQLDRMSLGLATLRLGGRQQSKHVCCRVAKVRCRKMEKEKAEVLFGELRMILHLLLPVDVSHWAG